MYGTTQSSLEILEAKKNLSIGRREKDKLENEGEKQTGLIKKDQIFMRMRSTKNTEQEIFFPKIKDTGWQIESLLSFQR